MGAPCIPANLLRNRGYWALISLSRDGELQNHIFRRFGFQTVRGSTGRGGIRGALQMARRVQDGGVLAFTPDGPRGPTHKVQLGVILMAEKSGAPIVPVGISASRRWLMKSWDSLHDSASRSPAPISSSASRSTFLPRWTKRDGEAVAEQVETRCSKPRWTTEAESPRRECD